LDEVLPASVKTGLLFLFVAGLLLRLLAWFAA
jgi:hypothetical protein